MGSPGLPVHFQLRLELSNPGYEWLLILLADELNNIATGNSYKSNTAMTIDLYSHIALGLQEMAARCIELVIGPEALGRSHDVRSPIQNQAHRLE